VVAIYDGRRVVMSAGLVASNAPFEAVSLQEPPPASLLSSAGGTVCTP
jgi:hypothetical protein